jgi:hypothetical protein
MSVFVLADEHIRIISELSSVKDALSGLKNAKKVSFTSELPTHIKDVIKVNIGLDLLNIKDVPMTWLVGDSAPHVDRGEKSFVKTYLIYLTDSEGDLIVENDSYPIKKGFGVAFNEGLSHKTLNSGYKPRLIIGPMSEQGFGVGNNAAYFYTSLYQLNIDENIGANSLEEVADQGTGLTIPATGIISGNSTQSGFNFATITSWYAIRSNIDPTYNDYFRVGNNGGLLNKNDNNYYTFYKGDILPVGETIAGGGSVYFKYAFLPSSNICFTAGSLVETDQGQVKIEEINTTLHTISGEQIIGLVESTGDMPCLAYIKQDLISPGVPDRDTYCSVWHKILFNGEMVEAQVVPGSQPYSYSKQTLYNILMEKHSTMKVNNMVVETLHPESTAAEIFLLTKKGK